MVDLKIAVDILAFSFPFSASFVTGRRVNRAFSLSKIFRTDSSIEFTRSRLSIRCHIRSTNDPRIFLKCRHSSVTRNYWFCNGQDNSVAEMRPFLRDPRYNFIKSWLSAARRLHHVTRFALIVWHCGGMLTRQWSLNRFSQRLFRATR